MSHIIADLSPDPVANNYELGEKATEYILLECPYNFLICYPEFKSHIIAVLSPDPEAKN